MSSIWLTSLWAAVAATTAGAATQTEPNSALLIAAFALAGGAALLFFLEIVVPSGGLLALLCAACIVASIVVMFMYDGTLGIVMMVGYLIVIPVALYWGVRLWERSPLGRKLILGAEEQWTSPDELRERSESARQERVSSIKSLVGEHGVADSALRPVGFVRIDGERLDAIAEGEMIEAGTPIEVVNAYDNQLKVRPIDENGPSQPDSG